MGHMPRDMSVSMRQAILPILLVNRETGHMEPVGTCFVVMGSGDRALAISAGHNFEYIHRLEGRGLESAPSMPDVLRPLRPPDRVVTRHLMKAVLIDDGETPFYVDIERVWLDAGHDLALVALKLAPEDHKKVSFKKRISVDSALPLMGTPLQVAGYSHLGDAHSPFQMSEDESRSSLTVTPTITFMRAEVVSLHPHGRLGGPKGPSFEANVQAIHGMSGGPVFHGRDGELVACGVVSRSTDFGGDDSTVCAVIWPIYMMKIEGLVANERAVSLLELQQHPQSGFVDVAQPHLHLEIAVDEHGSGNGTWTP